MGGASPDEFRQQALAQGGLLGSGLVRTTDGEPLRPGGPVLTETLLDWAAFRPGDVVVDVGCGQGASVGVMRRRRLHAIGIDIAAAPVALAARRAQAAFVAASGGALPLRSGTCDGVLAECSLSVMGRRRRILAEWRRVLRPGGRLVMSDIYRRRSGDGGEAAPADLSGMATWQAIADDVTAAGFCILRFEDRSDVLKTWAARFIFAYGSLDALWQGCCGATTEAVRAAAPGYFAMVAVRRGGPAVEERT